MPFSLIRHTARAKAGTTNAINTTGAGLLIVVTSSHNSDGIVTDSKNNTWNNLTVYTHSNHRLIIWYSIPTSVGGGHTFTYAGGETPSMCVAAFSCGEDNIAVFNKEIGSIYHTFLAQPGPITPDFNNSLIITALNFDVFGVVSVDSGFIITDQIDVIYDENLGTALAYSIQEQAATVDPGWTTLADNGIVSAAVFKLLHRSSAYNEFDTTRLRSLLETIVGAGRATIP